MDLATLVGLLGAFGIIIAAIVVGGSAIIFVNPPSLLIVVGGTLFAVLMKFPMGHFFSAFKVAAKAFFNKPEDRAQATRRQFRFQGRDHRPADRGRG